MGEMGYSMGMNTNDTNSSTNSIILPIILGVVIGLALALRAQVNLNTRMFNEQKQMLTEMKATLASLQPFKLQTFWVQSTSTNSLNFLEKDEIFCK